MFTPAISTGYWNAMNTPSRARSSGLIASRSRPSYDTSPSVTVVGMARQHARERALARAVRSHDGVDLAGVDAEVDAAQDRLAADRARGDC